MAAKSDDKIIRLQERVDREIAVAAEAVSVEDFYAYMPMHNYIFTPNRELWPATSVNARCQRPINPDGSLVTKKVRREGKNGAVEFKDQAVPITEWLDKNHPVDQMTWVPGEPMIIRGRLVSHGGWIERPGCSCFNLYLPPRRASGDAGVAGRWIEHVKRVFPLDFEHIIRWLAHRVQRPGEKINHALVMGGAQGIGKDTILEPVRQAIGPWNFAEVSPIQLLGRFNGFVKSVILRISEARDLGDIDRYGFYDHTKVYTAAPPDLLRCDEKHIREHSVFNVTGVIITTNHKTDGIYLPSDDRRHFVGWSDAKKEDFDASYWPQFYAWYASGGIGHVTAYLSQLKLSDFDPKAPPPKTAAWHEIVNASRAPEDAQVADALDAINAARARNGKSVPVPAVTLADITLYTDDEGFRVWLKDAKNRRQIPHRMEAVGYTAVRNEADKHDGQWKVDGKRQVIYARTEMSVRDRIIAATSLCAERR